MALASQQCISSGQKLKFSEYFLQCDKQLNLNHRFLGFLSLHGSLCCKVCGDLNSTTERSVLLKGWFQPFRVHLILILSHKAAVTRQATEASRKFEWWKLQAVPSPLLLKGAFPHLCRDFHPTPSLPGRAVLCSYHHLGMVSAHIWTEHWGFPQPTVTQACRLHRTEKRKDKARHRSSWDSFQPAEHHTAFLVLF